MARYEHLPIYRAAFDLAVHIERIVHNFSRYHKYTLGSELRNRSRGILERIIEANQSRDRGPVLEQLRRELESFKVLARLCQESQGFSGTRAYLYVAEQVVGLSKQNEGWLRQTTRSREGRDEDRPPARRACSYRRPYPASRGSAAGGPGLPLDGRREKRADLARVRRGAEQLLVVQRQ